jgi:hypothetical protein
VDRPFVAKALLVIAVILFIVAALGLGGVLFALPLLTGLALAAGGLAAWSLSALVLVL